MDLTHRSVKLCLLSRWTPHFDGFGFDLMTKKSGEGHYISMVHEGGPAEATHLEPGDWLIEVNGVNVEKLTHGEVIKLIKSESESGSVKLLLVPSETDKWRKRNQVTVTSSHPDLVHYITPPYQGKLRTFINGAIDRLMDAGKKGEPEDSEPVYHRYSLPLPSGMADQVNWSPDTISEPVKMRRSVRDEAPIAGSLDEQRQKEIVEWRDKSMEMLMANQMTEIEPIEKRISMESEGNNMFINRREEEISADNSNDNSKRQSMNQERVLVDVHSNDEITDSEVTIRTNYETLTSGLSGDHVTTLTLLDGEFFARQCKVKKSSETSDYGFKMDTLPSGGGHFLRSIEPEGPAGLSGIKQHDRLIEVNNANVEYTDHDTVVNMIRKSPDCEVTLLVVDERSYRWFKSRNIRIHHGTGGSLIRYCDPRGINQITEGKLDRPTSFGEDKRSPSPKYYRGMSYQSNGNQRQSAGNSSDIESDSRLDRGGDGETKREEKGLDANEEEEEDDRQSSGGKQREGLSKEARKAIQEKRESRTSQISDWSFGSMLGNSDMDRFTRGKTIIKVPDDAPRPRLCSITKDPDGIFGFTLNTYEKGRVKMIADIDRGSAAEAAGLLQWDRVIEVNGVNINIENHAQVTGRIEASGNRLHLLVLPEAQYGWYERARLVPRSNQSNVIYLSNTDVTRDSMVIARALESPIMLDYAKTGKKASFSSLAKSNSPPKRVTTPTNRPMSMVDSHEIRSMEGTRKEDQIKQPQPFQSNETNCNQQIDVNQIETNSTSSHPVNRFNTIDEETSEATHGSQSRENYQVSAASPQGKAKKSFTKKLFKRSLFSSKKNKLSFTASGGSLSNLSVKSDITGRGEINRTPGDLQPMDNNRTLKRSVTLLNNQRDRVKEEDDEDDYSLPREGGLEGSDNVHVVTVRVTREEETGKPNSWQSRDNNNINNNNNDVYNYSISRGENHVNDPEEGRVIIEEGQQRLAEMPEDSQLLEKLKSLNLQEIRKSRLESKIQAYQRMSQLNFSQRIKHFEDL